MNYPVILSFSLPVALYDWLSPGLSFIAELITLIGGFYGFFLLLLRLSRSNTTPVKKSASENPPSTATCSSSEALPVSPKTEPEPVLPAPSRVPTGELAVIAAVCHLILTRPHRIVSVRQVLGPGDPWSGGLDYISWSREGRRDIFTSHQLR